MIGKEEGKNCQEAGGQLSRSGRAVRSKYSVDHVSLLPASTRSQQQRKDTFEKGSNAGSSGVGNSPLADGECAEMPNSTTCMRKNHLVRMNHMAKHWGFSCTSRIASNISFILPFVLLFQK